MAVVKIIIPEDPANPYRLGRHIEHDTASRGYMAALAAQVKDVQHPSKGLPLNQGQLGKCTAEALCGRLNTTPGQPEPVWRTFTDVDSDRLYTQETTDEGSPYPPNDPGGSGLAVCAAAKELGWIKSYAHTFTFNSALQALTLRPNIWGLNWYDSMFNPDSNGLVTISPDAQIAGGHEILATAILTQQQLVGFWNSWGTGWGAGGRFYMSYATCERLLGEQGDVTVPYVR